jgi:PleD family two-component response regulator
MPEMDAKPVVLIADDSQISRKAVLRVLTEEFEVLEAESGQEALQILADNSEIQVLFVDLMMPGMDGFQVLKSLRESPNSRLRGLPVIILTAHDDSSAMRRKAMVLGANDFIAKPFDSLLLKTRARAHSRHSMDLTMSDSEDFGVVTGFQEISLIDADQLFISGQQLLIDSHQRQQPVSVLCLRVDPYLALLKTAGAKEASTLLEMTEKMITQGLRQEDMVARNNLGDFIILMPSVDAVMGRELVKGIYRRVRKSHPDLGNMRVKVTLSGGMVCSDARNDYALNRLIEEASIRMEKAVETGGNQLIYADMKKQRKPQMDANQGISLVYAIKALQQGKMDKLGRHVPQLLDEIFPLLVFANAEMQLGIDDALMKIRKRFAAQQTQEIEQKAGNS